MGAKIKIIVGCLLVLWALTSMRIVKAGSKNQIVSSEIVKVDSTLTHIKMVSPDEIQRLENNRSDEIGRLQDRITKLESRVAGVEEQLNK